MARAIVLTCCAAAALAVLACATAPGAGPVDPGPELYRSRCAACHRLYAPSERTPAAWASVLERMAPRAHLSAGEREALLRYLSGGR